MDNKVLFTITEDLLETGMRGYPVGYCTTSAVDPHEGLSYVGIPIGSLIEHTEEEVIYLLYYGKLPSNEELIAFKQTLSLHRNIEPEFVEAIYALPRHGEPIELFAAAILLRGMFKKHDNYTQDGIQLVAEAPEIAAHVINHHMGKPKKKIIDASFGYMEHFMKQLFLKVEDEKSFLDTLRLFNILHYDHNGGNLSTFVGKAVASGLESMHGAIASAIIALAGPRHGRANQDCLKFTKGILKETGPNATEEIMRKAIKQTLEKGELVFGFGHAVLRVEDPRAAILYRLGDERFQNSPLFKIAELLRKVAPEVLKEYSKIANPYANVDAISGTILAASGFDYPEYFPLLFALSRLVGISRQIIYERCEARNGKGTPIVRPNYIYKEREKS